MRRTKRIWLLTLLLLLFAAEALAEGGLNAFMGSAPASGDAETYQPKSNTSVDENVEENDSLIYYFYRPTCKYCSERADMILAGLPERITLDDGRKSTIRIVALNKSDPKDGEIIQSYYEREGISKDRQLVPTLIIGDYYLCGSGEIKSDFLRLLLHGDGKQTPYIDGRRSRR